MSNHKILSDMLGHHHRQACALKAARFLSGRDHDPQDVRSASWFHDGDPDLTALRVHGLPTDSKTLRALKGLQKLVDLKKAEAPPVEFREVLAARHEGTDVAEQVERTNREGGIHAVDLGGIHSKGALLSVDSQSGKAWILKPGSGGPGPEAGAMEQSATQSEREAAFYHVATSWGLGGFYPRTELLLLDGRQYAAIELLASTFQNMNDIREEHPGLQRHIFHPFLKSGMLHKWAAVDAILGQPDRNWGNIMVQIETSQDGLQDLPGMSETSPVRLIDQGSALDGVDFDPANDLYSFTPAYLRAWYDGNFHQLGPEERLEHLPGVDEETEKELRSWLMGIDPAKLELELGHYGVNSEACLYRLSNLKAAAEQMPASLAVNRFWSYGS